MTQSATWKGHEGPVLDRVDDFEVVDCEPCGFRHVIPLPTALELRDVYQHDYYTAEKPLYLERAREDLDWWNVVYRERYETFEKLLGEGRRRVLDVGSGPGFFLAFGKERGWQTLGVEPSERAAGHARELGLEIVDEFLDEELARRLGAFDAIHMNEVLEHLPDPKRQLELCIDMLAPGGVVCIAVPNDYSPFQRALRDVCGFRPWWVAPPHHLNYFDFDTLCSLLERCGYEVAHTEATFPIDLFLLMGDDYVGDDDVGRACHARRMRFEANLEAAGLGGLKRELYAKLGELGIGRQVLVFARRPAAAT